ncbi:MAG: prepilin-type N-terminal cleavage/methylation domain-containing protein [Deltaproteobacteria bacterium]|jgi:prepilin-type N-terminal cleavage/methylation domain-containing protein|nr:prepilin-type N-terminal cleavage/methylation domain-containing protein [Deltaproteobacteria bacterium]
MIAFDPQSTGRRPDDAKRGFSLIEIVIVIAITAIIIGIAVPSIGYYLKSSRIRTEARYLESIFQRGRMMAVVNQKPVRVVLDCVNSPATSCKIRLEVAKYTGAGVDSWETAHAYSRTLNDNVGVIKTEASAPFDGAAVVSNLYWAIFMPDSHVYSNPRPFSVFFHYLSDSSERQAGWRVSLSAESGRVDTRRDEVAI